MARMWNITGHVLLLAFLFGCGRNSIPPEPAPKPAAGPTSTKDARQDEVAPVEQIGSQISKQLEKSFKDLEQRKLVLLIDGIRDDKQWESIKEQAQKLVDANAGNRSVVTKGGYGDSYLIEVSPVSDLESTLTKIKFGAIVGVDPGKRTAVVDVASQTVSRPEAGWPGPPAVRQFIGRKMAAWALLAADKDLIKKLGPEKTVVVCYPGSTTPDTWSDSIRRQVAEARSRRDSEERATRGDCKVTCGSPHLARLKAFRMSAAATQGAFCGQTRNSA